MSAHAGKEAALVRDSFSGRALTAAKNPQLKLKLQNMPVPLTSAKVDEYMGPILEAARYGDISRIKNVAQ